MAARFGKALLGIGLFVTGFFWLVIVTHHTEYPGPVLPFGLFVTAIPAAIGFLGALVFGAIR